MRIFILFFFIFSFSLSLYAQVIPAAYSIKKYLPWIKNKKIALVVNQTSMIGSTHLADTLLSHSVNVVKIFAPEHGFRGTADAGEKVKSGVDSKTGLPVISLYGDHKKPTKQDLEGINLIIYDIQDVGARFYTYISTLGYLMEACSENRIPLLILDRPSPKANCIDGPVLKMEFKSFVGMFPIPILYGMTPAEFARMVNGQRWLKMRHKCKLRFVTVKNYHHDSTYILPVKPSPNLPNAKSIHLYPSLCLFEGTTVSVGRGTSFPFQVIGSPDTNYRSTFDFTPQAVLGAMKPMYLNQKCFGLDLRESIDSSCFTLQPLIDFYNKSSNKTKFFNSFFTNLAGNDLLRKQIESGMPESEIRKTWEQDLIKFKSIRRKYLIYEE